MVFCFVLFCFDLLPALLFVFLLFSLKYLFVHLLHVGRSDVIVLSSIVYWKSSWTLNLNPWFCYFLSHYLIFLFYRLFLSVVKVRQNDVCARVVPEKFSCWFFFYCFYWTNCQYRSRKRGNRSATKFTSWIWIISLLLCLISEVRPGIRVLMVLCGCDMKVSIGKKSC